MVECQRHRIFYTTLQHGAPRRDRRVMARNGACSSRYCADRWLAYVTGGVALADIKAQIINENITYTESHIRGGWTVGGGLELALDRNWSAKLEYLHVGLTDTPYFTPAPGVNNPDRGGGVPLNQEIVRGGLSYRFN